MLTVSPCRTHRSRSFAVTGAEIQGIIQKTGYLSHLGISAVWVTPLMENVRAYVPDTGYMTGYHSYWSRTITV